MTCRFSYHFLLIVDIVSVPTAPGAINPDPKLFPASVTTAYSYIVIQPLLTANPIGAGYTVSIDAQSPVTSTNFTLSPNISHTFTIVPTLTVQGQLMKCVYGSKSYSFSALSKLDVMIYCFNILQVSPFLSFRSTPRVISAPHFRLQDIAISSALRCYSTPQQYDFHQQQELPYAS